jgi:hypothetical protein
LDPIHKNITLLDSALEGMVEGGIPEEKAMRFLRAEVGGAAILEQGEDKDADGVSAAAVESVESECEAAVPQTLVGFFNRDAKKNDGEYALQAHIPRPLLYEGTRKVRRVALGGFTCWIETSFVRAQTVHYLEQNTESQVLLDQCSPDTVFS